MKTLPASALAIALSATLVPLPAVYAAAPAAFNQDALPSAVKVPAGNRVFLETVGAGEITYECRSSTASAGTLEWVFVGPKADLATRDGKKIGSYFGPPATWAAADGSAVTGKQISTAPAGSGNIAAQLVQAHPATGSGAMSGITYIQRVATRGGVAPARTCDKASIGNQEIVKYQGDYIFWKAQ